MISQNKSINIFIIVITKLIILISVYQVKVFQNLENHKDDS